MANSFATMLVLLIFSALALSFSTLASFSPTSVAATQLKFWSENVNGDIPKSLLSKLSPLSLRDKEYFASLASKASLKADPNFCSLANLACTSKLETSALPKVKNAYNEYGVAGMSPRLEQVDPNSFFRLSILKKGNPVRLPNLHDQFPPRSFLPDEIASKISTTSMDIHMIFPDSFDSPAAKDAIQSTFAYCDAKELKGEIKSCPKSLEEMIGFAKKVLGQKRVRALVSESAKGSGSELIIGHIKQFRAEKFVSCHEVFLPFASHFCHLHPSTRLYAVDLIEVGTRAPVNTILATCHMDTADWPAGHAAFKILKSSPGHTEACHWLTRIDLVWLA